MQVSASSRGKVIYEQGGNKITDRRAIRGLYLVLFMFILATISLAAWLVALHIHPRHGAPMLFAWSMLLLTVLLIKPYRRVMVQR